MKSNSSRQFALYGAATLLGAAGLASIYLRESPTAAGATQATQVLSNVPDSSAARGSQEAALAAQGLLWEPTSTGAQRLRAALPVQAGPLRQVVGQAVGERVSLKLSERFPALVGSVSGSFTQDDGTTLTTIRIEGNPAGTLSVQENQRLGFFLGQLVYDNHPVAYEFRPSGSGLMATRHPLSNLICAMLNPDLDGIEAMGLPTVDKGKADKAHKRDVEAIATQKLLQEAKTSVSTTTTLGMSVADASMTEGNSGTTNLLFTVTLSKANRTKTISAKYATVNGSALGGSDFTAATGTVTFPPGAISLSVAVPVIGDLVQETAETFKLQLSSPVNATLTDGSAIGTILDNDAAVVASNVPVLNSLPGAVAVAYLDMDGQVVSGTQWAGGGTIAAGGISNTYTQAQMTEIWRRVTEDYAPFQINVTTNEAVFLAAPSDRRIRCIITPDNEWYGTAGGVAYLNSFIWTGDTPCWVFSDQLANSARYIAEACAHEVGHTLSLKHDGRTSPVEAYYQGHGSGEVGWAPIMGVGYYQLLVQWSRGEYLNSNNIEDDLGLITSKNGFGYRLDRQPATPAGAPALTVNGTSVTGSGIIETRDDADTFAFTTMGGTVSLTTLGDSVSQDLDLLLEVLDAGGNVLAAGNPDTLTDATVSAMLAAGTYYVRVSGVGRGNPLADGYTDYGSLGQYTISGTVP